jgi:hypothetical protein
MDPDSLCLAPRSCASAVGRDLHLRQSDHCRRIGMGAPWRTPDIADVGWLRAGCRFSNRGVAARSRISGSKKHVSAYVAGVFATVAFRSILPVPRAVCERAPVAATVEKVRDLASFRLGPRVGGAGNFRVVGRRGGGHRAPQRFCRSQAGEAPTAGATWQPFRFATKNDSVRCLTVEVIGFGRDRRPWGPRSGFCRVTALTPRVFGPRTGRPKGVPTSSRPAKGSVAIGIQWRAS